MNKDNQQAKEDERHQAAMEAAKQEDERNKQIEKFLKAFNKLNDKD